MTEAVPLPPALDRWQRVAWRALQHLITTRREIMMSIAATPKDNKNKKITQVQSERPHPKQQRRRGGNRYRRYTHCVKCGLRLQFTPANAAAAKPSPTATPCPKASASLPAGGASSSTSQLDEQSINFIVKSQHEQTRLLSDGLRLMMDNQARMMGTMVESLDRLQGSIAASSRPTTEPVQPDSTSEPFYGFTQDDEMGSWEEIPQEL